MEDKFSNLRKKAEQHLSKTEIDISKLTEDEIKSIIHNLEVHQVELEMQNIELKNIQQDLEKSRDEYFELFEFAPVGFANLDIRMKIINSNQVFSELTGFKKSQIKGKLITDFIHPDFQDTFYLAHRELIKEGKKQSVELKIRNNLNDRTWVRVEFNTNKERESLLLSFIDISEQKKSSDALKLSEAKLSSVIKNFPSGSINLINKDLRFELVGGVDYTKHNIPEHELIGKHVTEILEEKLAHKAVKGIKKAFDGETITYETDFRDKVYRNIISPVILLNGKPDYVLLISLNITDKIRTEQELKKSEERFKRLAENAKDLIYRMSLPNGIYEYVSPASKEIFGYSPQEFYDNPILIKNAIHPAWNDYFKEKWENLVSGKMDPTYEYQIIDKEGKTKWLYQRNVLVKDNNGKPIFIEGIVTDITDRKRAVNELRTAKEAAEENEAMLQAAMGNSQAGIAIADVPTGKLRFVNKAGLLVGDKDYDEVVKNVDIEKYVSSWQILHFDGTPFATDEVPLTRAVKFGETCSKEFIVRRDNNEDRYVWANAGPILNKAGEQIAAIVVFLDITAMKIAENALAESESRFRSLFDNAMTGVFYINTEGEIIEANPKIIELLGSLSIEETKKINVLTFPPLVANGYAKNFKKSIEEGVVVFDETSYKSKWGKTMHVRYYFNPIKVGNEIVGVLANVEDISELRKAERQIAENEERLRLALDGASDGVWDWNLLTNEIYFSPNWKKILGYEVDELENKFSTWEEYTHPEDVKKSWEQLTKYLNGESDMFKMEFKMKHKNGHWVDIFSRAVAAERGKDGKVTRIVGTHVDISELKKTQENLAIALNESEKKQKEISELLKATHAILSTTDFEEAARKIFEACKLSIGAKAGYIALLDETEQQNELLFLDDGGLPCTVDPNLPMPVRGLREEAYKTGKVVYNNNFMNSKWAKFMPKGHVNLPNVLFAPLIIHDKAVGVLGLSNKDTDFTEDDANLAFAFAEYAAIALLNSQAREKLEIRAKELQESNAMKDKLFSVIGHDLKNPLNNIINVTEAMHKGFGEMPENLKEKVLTY
jgi:PAS domain S-box-containing protein